MTDTPLGRYGDNVWRGGYPEAGDSWVYGRMGDDLPFVDLGGDYNATHLSDSPGTNSNYCAVLHPDGEIKCWGYAATGALGQGTTTNAEMGDALPAVRTAHGPKLSVAVAGVGPWTCTLDDDNDFCAPRTITLSSVGNDTVEWLLVPEAGRVYANGTGGKLEPGETATVALSIEEAALAFGSNDVSATLYTSETGPQCHPGRLDGSVQGATCEVHNFTGTVTMDASASAWAWISSGMVVLPRSHMLEVVLDEGLEVNSSALLVDRTVEAAPYDVTVTGDSGCATLISVPAGASGQLKRMQNQLMAFEVDGTDLASGSPTACSASVRRVDSGKVENITFTVTGRPGAPSPELGRPGAFVPDYSRRRRAPRPGGGGAAEEPALLLGPGAGAAAERVYRAWDGGGARLPVAKVRALAAEIRIEDAEAARRTDALINLLPGLESKVLTMQVKALGALVRDLRAVARRAVRLRQVFPTTDISRLVARSGNAWMLLDEWAAVEARLEEAVFMLNTYQRSAEEMRCPDGVADPYRNA